MRPPLGHKIQVALTRFHCAFWSHKGVQEKEQCEIYLQDKQRQDYAEIK